MDTIATSFGPIDINYTFGENPCLHIKNSHLIEDGSKIKSILKHIHTLPTYKQLQKAGYNRSFKSEYREWKAHNFLYRIGYKRDQTAHVDIDNKEPMWRRFLYAILSIF